MVIIDSRSTVWQSARLIVQKALANAADPNVGQVPSLLPYTLNHHESHSVGLGQLDPATGGIVPMPHPEVPR